MFERIEVIRQNKAILRVNGEQSILQPRLLAVSRSQTIFPRFNTLMLKQPSLQKSGMTKRINLCRKKGQLIKYVAVR